MPQLFRTTIAILSATALSGCAAMNSVSWQFDGPDQLGDTDVITVDAKQRHLVMFQDAKGNLRMCAEAAPDVFSALSSSLTGGFDFGGANQKAEAAAAIAESAATIERTQTVNLLRESFYRTCERWLSGAIDSDEFHILAARDHRSMVAVLAIEQLTGVVKAQSTIISGPAARAISAQNEQLVSLLQTYTAQRVAAKSALDTADKELAEANVEVPVAGAKSKVCDLPTRPDDADAGTKYDICAAKKAAQKTASDEYQAALLRENSVIKNIDKLSSAIGASTDTGKTEKGETGDDRSDVSDVKIALLAPAIEKIALTAGIDEALMFCIGYLRSRPFILTDTTRDTCNRVVEQKSRRDVELVEDITRTQSAAHDRIWNGKLDPLTVAQIETNVVRYKNFKLRFRFLLSVTPRSEWNVLWPEFAAKTGLNPKDPNRCSSLSICISVLSEAGSNPFNVEYRDRPGTFDDALNAWEAALSAD